MNLRLAGQQRGWRKGALYGALKGGFRGGLEGRGFRDGRSTTSRSRPSTRTRLCGKGLRARLVVPVSGRPFTAQRGATTNQGGRWWTCTVRGGAHRRRGVDAHGGRVNVLGTNTPNRYNTIVNGAPPRVSPGRLHEAEMVLAPCASAAPEQLGWRAIRSERAQNITRSIARAARSCRPALSGATRTERSWGASTGPAGLAVLVEGAALIELTSPDLAPSPRRGGAADEGGTERTVRVWWEPARMFSAGPHHLVVRVTDGAMPRWPRWPSRARRHAARLTAGTPGALPPRAPGATPSYAAAGPGGRVPLASAGGAVFPAQALDPESS